MMNPIPSNTQPWIAAEPFPVENKSPEENGRLIEHVNHVAKLFQHLDEAQKQAYLLPKYPSLPKPDIDGEHYIKEIVENPFPNPEMTVLKPEQNEFLIKALLELAIEFPKYSKKLSAYCYEGKISWQCLSSIALIYAFVDELHINPVAITTLGNNQTNHFTNIINNLETGAYHIKLSTFHIDHTFAKVSMDAPSPLQSALDLFNSDWDRFYKRIKLRSEIEQFYTTIFFPAGNKWSAMMTRLKSSLNILVQPLPNYGRIFNLNNHHVMMVIPSMSMIQDYFDTLMELHQTTSIRVIPTFGTLTAEDVHNMRLNDENPLGLYLPEMDGRKQSIDLKNRKIETVDNLQGGKGSFAWHDVNHGLDVMMNDSKFITLWLRIGSLVKNYLKNPIHTEDNHLFNEFVDAENLRSLKIDKNHITSFPIIPWSDAFDLKKSFRSGIFDELGYVPALNFGQNLDIIQRQILKQEDKTAFMSLVLEDMAQNQDLYAEFGVTVADLTDKQKEKYDRIFNDYQSHLKKQKT